MNCNQSISNEMTLNEKFTLLAKNKKKSRFNHYFKVLIQINKNLVKLLN